MLMGLGKEPRRTLLEVFQGNLPAGCDKPVVFLPGTLVVQGKQYSETKELPRQLAACPALADWPVVLLVDDSSAATKNLQEFLWTFFTRFEPAGDIHARESTVSRFHVGLEQPVVFDCRLKPWYPHVLEVDEKTKKQVDDKIADILPPRFR
jgi:3-polyprenyl-4-hydroxybenzoate decarboxylase